MTPDEITHKLSQSILNKYRYPVISKVFKKILDFQQNFYIADCKEKGICLYFWVITKCGKKYYFSYSENDRLNNDFALQNPKEFIKRHSLYFARFLVLFSSFWDYDPIVSFHFCENQQDAYYCELMQRFQLGVDERVNRFRCYLIERIPQNVFTMDLEQFQIFCQQRNLDFETLLHFDTIEQLKNIEKSFITKTTTTTK